MSDINAIPPPIPATMTPAPPRREPPLGSDPAEQVPITGVTSALEAILRQPRRVIFQLRQSGPGGLIAALLLIALACSLVYGEVVGTFSGERQLWAAPLKVAMVLILSALICLPSLYIFSCLSGSQARLVEVFGLVSGLLALMTLLLLGFAPVAWVFSQSMDSVAAMGSLHLVFGLVAAYFGLRFLYSGFVHLSAKAGGSLNVWIVIFLLVALQMTTALRPILGKGDAFLQKEKKFFATHWAELLRN